jgi:hypothetical protein
MLILHILFYLSFFLILIVLSRVRGSVTNNNGFWIAWLDLLTLFLQSLLINISYNSSHSMIKTSSISYWTTRVFSSYCGRLGSDLRVGHFVRFRCPLIKTPQLNSQLNSTT